ncbi:nucleotide-diphospho-sugar transferase [Coniella lustricola]|uniref:Nucleotide-diphospho-sugar transferase n=1 Tax=Coniella lustricola TaxID=2025994 RepID=A0A2T3A619_9PEZI|nr:nucleotide-diphospho-sugar transferase [Coniella lustricola]
MILPSFSTLGSPLVSPRLGAQLRNGVPMAQIRRWAPYAAFVFVVFLFAQMVHFEERDLEQARSWTEKNPDWRYEVLTDGNDLRYVEYHYGPEGFNRPDIVAFYRDVTASIIKADLLRYLIMYAEGGVYADIDVEAMKPMSKFIPERYDHRDIDMVIGVEIDEPEWKDHPILGPKSRSFCQWTFMCKPQLPVMMRLVENIMHWLVDVANNQTVSISEVTLDFDEVISGTGPSAFTRAIIAQMNFDRVLAAEQEKAEGGKPAAEVTWDVFHDLDESKLVDRVLVLNVEAFAAGQGHSNSGTHDTRHSLVRHHYHASNWPSRHPRYKHPAYGQVEDCNWNKDCVHRWDEDVAHFATLPVIEQERIVAEKTKEREEKEAEEARKKEEEEARNREEDEKRKKEDDERIRAEDEARRLKDEEEKNAAEGRRRRNGKQNTSN